MRSESEIVGYENETIFCCFFRATGPFIETETAITAVVEIRTEITTLSFFKFISHNNCPTCSRRIHSTEIENISNEDFLIIKFRFKQLAYLCRDYVCR